MTLVYKVKEMATSVSILHLSVRYTYEKFQMEYFQTFINVVKFCIGFIHKRRSIRNIE